jgi:putative hydrolase of the HAD superfamily
METKPVHKIRAIFFDSGDTIVDEATELKDEHQVTQEASLIPGAAETVRALKRLGYPLALVADGPAGTFYNVLGHYRLLDLFDALAISGQVGVEKPDPRMFECALEQLHLPTDACGKVLMVGNNLERDIKGANQMGIISVWLDWAPRRSKIPADASEQPCYTIKNPLELLDLVERLEKSLP